ncbi:hypothetical protein M8J77_016331 [Diaphorina citri]|nr:hypothetical protein M8J77_016331 [Diaphorina citri]
MLNNRTNGLSRKVLLRLYKCYVRPIIEYGAPIYGSASDKQLSRLEPIQNMALRISTGAFKSSRIENLQVDAGEPPLNFRRYYLSGNYVAKVIYNINNPMRDIIMNISRHGRDLIFVNSPKPLAVRFSEWIDLKNIYPLLRLPSCPYPPWQIRFPQFEKISASTKHSVLPQEFQLKYCEYINKNRQNNSLIRLKYNLNNLQIKDILGDNPRTIDLLFKFLKDSNLLPKL